MESTNKVSVDYKEYVVACSINDKENSLLAMQPDYELDDLIHIEDGITKIKTGLVFSITDCVESIVNYVDEDIKIKYEAIDYEFSEEGELILHCIETNDSEDSSKFGPYTIINLKAEYSFEESEEGIAISAIYKFKDSDFERHMSILIDEAKSQEIITQTSMSEQIEKLKSYKSFEKASKDIWCFIFDESGSYYYLPLVQHSEVFVPKDTDFSKSNAEIIDDAWIENPESELLDVFRKLVEDDQITIIPTSEVFSRFITGEMMPEFNE